MNNKKICATCVHSESDFYCSNGDCDEIVIYECNIKDCIVGEYDDACDQYEEYVPKPYEETKTKCDSCDKLIQHINEGDLCDCTNMLDKFRHYMPSIDFECQYREINEV